MGRAALIAAAGGLFALVGYLYDATPVGALAWCAALFVACVGSGGAFARVMRERASVAMRAVIGLGLLLAVSTLLARLGLLTRGCQLVVVAVGIVAGIAAPLASVRPSRRDIVAGLLGVMCIAVALVHESTIIADGVNATVTIKRLWDTGSLGTLHHQLGAQVVGESLAALASGAHTPALFDAGFCIALLLLLLASDLTNRAGVFVVFAIALALHPATAQGDIGIWAAVLLIVAGFHIVRCAFEEKRNGWLAVPIALALASLRHEYALIALPLLVSAIWLPTRSLPLRWWVPAWALALIGMELAYNVAPSSAVVRCAAILTALPITWLVTWLAGSTRERSLTVLLLATTSLTIATWAKAITPSFQGPDTLAAIWYAVAITACTAIGTLENPNRRFRLFAAALVWALVIETFVTRVNFIDALRQRSRGRLTDAASRIDEVRTIGYRLETEAVIAALQSYVPAHARIGFWGQNAALLDFSRNPIRDISWQVGRWRTHDYLAEIDPKWLRNVDYVIVQGVAGRVVTDNWGRSYAEPLFFVGGRLEPVRGSSGAALFRVSK